MASAALSLVRWNELLVSALFEDEARIDLPIRRIECTPRFLVRVVGQSGVTPIGGARRSFISAFPSDPSEIRRLLSVRAIPEGWSPNSPALPFFAQLYLTLIVAAADEETHAVGHFRTRLARTLGVEDGFESALVDPTLPRLWEAARDWSEAQSAGERATRTLVLPDPRHETIIGYSKRLSFPGFIDQRHLAKELTQAGLRFEDPPQAFLAPVYRAVRARRQSTRLHEEYLAFREALLVGDLERIQATPMWAALESVTWDEWKTEGASLAVRLELDPSNPRRPEVLAHPLSSDSAEALRAAVRGSREHEGRAELPVIRDPSRRSTLDILLDPTSPSGSRLRELGGLRQPHADGCIGFCYDERGCWTAARTWTGFDRAWLLIDGRLRARLEATLSSIGCVPVAVDEALKGDSGWRIVGPLSFGLAAREALPEGASVEFSFFAESIAGRSLTLRGGVTLPDGVLLLPAVRPSASRPGADSLTITAHEQGGHSIIESLDTTSGTFEVRHPGFEAARAAGRVRLSALRAGRVLAQRTVDFVFSSSRGEAWAQPAPERWLRLTDRGELVSAGSPEPSPEPEAGLMPPLVVGATRRVGAPVVQERIADSPRIQRVPITPEPWSDFLEALCGAYAVRRHMDTIQLLALVERGFGITSWAGKADRLTSLVENGYVDRFFVRHWSGSSFFPNRPTATYTGEIATAPLRISGLMTRITEARIHDAARRFGATAGRYISEGGEALGVLEISGGAQDRIAAELAQIGVPCAEAAEEDSMPAVPLILGGLRHELDRIRSGSELLLWDAQRGFREELSRHELPDRALVLSRSRKRQSDYILIADGHVWRTRSKTWALLLWTALSGEAVGEWDAHAGVLRTRPPLKMPASVARAVRQTGAGICCAGVNRGRIYGLGDRGARIIRFWLDAGECRRGFQHWALAMAQRRGGGRPAGLRERIHMRYVT